MVRKKKRYKYVYGPVSSWRLGNSLGIDPISTKGKTCTFDCVYCQLGRTKALTDKRRTFVPASAIIKELNSLPPLKIDYITFSGTGEPTLAKNLGDMIKAVKRIRKERIAVLTNSSLLHKPEAIKDLLPADLIVAKLDAPSQAFFRKINRPVKAIDFEPVVSSIKRLKSIYEGRLALQVMFVDDNKACAQAISHIAREIGPDEVQINTPLRPCGVKPLKKAEIEGIEKCFHGLNTVSVYRAKKKKVKPISFKETLARRGKIK